ncbi:MAG: Gfo/Idh/MocA family oxidoreductase [Oscillospiraceae bacterium]
MKKIGFIGYGLRSDTMMEAFTALELDIAVAAIADPRSGELRESLSQKAFFENTSYYNTAEEMLQNENLDGVFVGTRCALHAELAALALSRGIPLFLEKPVCINSSQYGLLLNAGKGMENRVVVSFPLRLTSIVQEMKQLVDSGALGDIVTVQAINNVPYGNVYYHSWYRDASLTGGLFLQKSTHDIDYITYILGKRPTSVTAQTAKMYFKGDKPANLRCEDCAENHTCTESSYTTKHILNEVPTGEYCCFATDTGNEDVAAAIFTCDDGTIISYHQVFLVKNSAGRRGARFIGTKGSAEFDFYTATIHVDYYSSKHSADHSFTFPQGTHFGGDKQLALAFMDVLNGKESRSNLSEGLASAAACLGAKKSAETHSTVTIDYGFDKI